MKKVLFLVCSFFLGICSVRAISLNCPEIVSPGEVIICHVDGDNQYQGFRVKYQIDSVFSYQKIKLASVWKSYYDGVDGFSVGNVSDDSNLSLDIQLKVGLDAIVNRKYLIQLVDIEGSTLDNQYVSMDDVTSEVKVVSDVNTLDSLEISNGKFQSNFDKNVTRYEAIVDSDKTIIQATASDVDAKVEGDIGEKTLNYGVNVFTVKVISARGNVREYYLYITRTFQESKKSSDITLKELSLDGVKIDFKKDIFLYFVSVDYAVDKIKVSAVPSQEKAKVVIEGGDSLVVGENLIRILVTAEDGTIGTYVVNVERKKQLSNDATIKSLAIKGYVLDFQSDIYEYTLEIGNEEKLNLDVVLNDEGASYRINGNKNLKNNSVIEIEVIAEDGSKKIYQIHIVKLNESNSNSIFSGVQVFPLVLFVLFMGCILVVKIGRRKFLKKN